MKKLLAVGSSLLLAGLLFMPPSASWLTTWTASRRTPPLAAETRAPRSRSSSMSLWRAGPLSIRACSPASTRSTLRPVSSQRTSSMVSTGLLQTPKKRNTSLAWPCGSSKAAWLLFLFLASLLLPSRAQADEGYAEVLVEKAMALKLHERRAWQVLLHYKPNMVGEYRSLVDDPGVFNSPQGKYDAREGMRGP